ncbi:peptidyl-prolyl cis-trans isomerase FKBP62-like [Beta vulgaris subsp. vulgaris]|uniref:peptidyl-prolyl cis-trans isomerase FKBP62-like n=1 Tax=Beta vulgaris subsp. vulgaris TaxID=3555 RepID=UPI002548C917|nr:peptidyl-prolyl cis-trans isomerase FKBP62-like [Beta vulgaris subsp. vulgaris]
MNSMDELKGELCLYHFDELDCSSTSWVQRLDFLLNPFGIFEYARSLKAEGNTFYRNNDFKSAIAQYSQAIKFLFFANVTNEEDKSVFLSLALAINLNLAACFIKKKDFKKVGELCSLILMYDATNAKAYFRRAVAALELSQLDITLIDIIQLLNSTNILENFNKNSMKYRQC